MQTAALLFAATFAVVFTLGLQQLNVTGGHMMAAFFTSAAITGSNLVLFKLLPGQTSALDLAGHFLGGAVGIVASMWAHPHLLRWARRSKAPEISADAIATSVLAHQIAADAARCDIESHCETERIGNLRWYDTNRTDSDDPAVIAFVHNARQYLNSCGLITVHPTVKNLVRFHG